MSSLTNEEKEHHNLLLLVANERNNKMMTNITNAKNRLINIIILDFTVISIMSAICFYL